MRARSSTGDKLAAFRARQQALRQPSLQPPPLAGAAGARGADGADDAASSTAQRLAPVQPPAAPCALPALAGAGAQGKAVKLAAFRVRPQLPPQPPSSHPAAPEAGASAVATGAALGASQPPGSVARAPAPATEARADDAAEAEVDPLDAYMANQLDKAQRDIAASAAREAAEQAAIAAGGCVHIDAPNDLEVNMALHCYICKKRGHTKKDCPDKKCRFCGEPGHAQRECDAFQKHLDAEAAEERARKRQAAHAKKKERRKEDWEAHLRQQTGIEGYEVLYAILELPPRKLATKSVITKAYHRISLRCHPDRVSSLPDDERDKASERFLAAKAAYDLLCEGMANGGKGFGGPVFSAGEIEARFASSTGVALATASGRAASAAVDGGGASS
ncbi:hypothetical protein KFE25_004438 [Diacronema lutheri]|uniref:Uncharacterized protein n=1 Tax=Diacronema lutheri TaxID=2081491 RepID=A0A8J6C7X9_DIALT|nr:hypothetical protein KFE25_004438 [Diacronema lutheri]